MHEDTIKRWIERHLATGDIESHVPLRASLVSTPLLKETALKVNGDGQGCDLHVCHSVLERTPKGAASTRIFVS